MSSIQDKNKNSAKSQNQPSKCNCFMSPLFSAFSSLPKGIFSVSLFGLFLGISTTMVYSQLSLFLKYELHASELKIALIDGVVEFIAYAMRVFSGVISDYLRNRKLLLLAGCTVTLLMKPLFAIAQSAFMVFVAQAMERVGNGLQAVPRDALIADLSPKETLGQSFGFSRSFKTAGSLLGTCIAILIMWLTCNNFRLVFLCSAIAVLVSIFYLSKVKAKEEIYGKAGQTTDDKNAAPFIKKPKIENPFQKKYLQSMDRSFWKMITLAAIFELGHFSEHLLPIYGRTFVSITMAGSVGMFISIGQIFCSFPIGLYADRLGKGKFIKICMLMMIAANLLFISAEYIGSIFPVYAAAFLWGGQMTAVQGLFLSIITERIDSHLRGTAIGLYYCSIGTSYLIASAIAGDIWNEVGSFYAFIYSIVFCLISLSLFRVLLPKKYEFEGKKCS